MPALLTKTVFKSRLKEIYGERISLVGKYINTMAYTRFKCQCGHEWKTQPQILLYTKSKEGRKYGCPKCAVAAVGRFNTKMAKKRKQQNKISPWTDVQAYYKKVENKWGDRFFVNGYSGAKSKVEVRCTRCGYKWNTRPTFYLDKNPCRGCVSDRSHENLNDSLKTFIVYAYTKLYFNTNQIAYLTGLQLNTVRKSLNAQDVICVNGELKRGKRSQKMLFKGRSVTTAKLYLRFSRRLTEWIVKKYGHTIDPAGLLLENNGRYHVDHILSVKDAFIRYPRPLDIRLVNHPANLQVLTSKLNLLKSSTSWLSVKELKAAAREYERKNGKVIFPSGFKFNFSRKIDLTKLDGVTIIGLDPGSKNFGLFVGRLYGADKLFRIEVLHSTMLQHTIHDLSDPNLDRTIERFLDEIGYVYDKYLPDLVVIERFQARGIKGSINETVNMMIGMILMQGLQAYCDVIPVVRPCTPASWKNKVNRLIDLNELYVQGKKIGLPPHQIDAALLGINQFPSQDSLDFLKKKNKCSQFLAALVKPNKIDMI